jgi:hypothetical protein
MIPQIQSPIRQGSSPGAIGWSYLPPTACTHICSSHKDINELRKQRLISQSWQGPAAQAVRRLLAPNFFLPRRAWDTFRSATSLIIILDLSSSSDLIPQLEHFFKAVPCDRPTFTRLAMEWAPCVHQPTLRNAKKHEAEALLHEFFEQLPHHPCAKHITEMDIKISLMPRTAQNILKAFPSLQGLKMMTSCPTEQERPVTISHFSPSLRHLRLHTWPRHMIVDAQGLVECEQLQSVALHMWHSTIINAESITALEHLHTLELQTESQLKGMLALAKHVPSLRCVRLPTLVTGRLYHTDNLPDPNEGDPRNPWPELAALQGVQELQLKALVVHTAAAAVAASPQLHHITRLVADEVCFAPGTAHISCRRAALQHLLPAVQQVQLNSSVWYKPACVAGTLQGHAQLQELSIRAGEGAQQGIQQWNAQLGSCPKLRVLRLYGVQSSIVDGMLCDVACCAELREVEVLCAAESYDSDSVLVTGAGLRGLAAGACRGALQRVVVQGEAAQASPVRFSVQDVAGLLKGCSGLHELVLDVGCTQGRQHEAGAAAGAAGAAADAAAGAAAGAATGAAAGVAGGPAAGAAAGAAEATAAICIGSSLCEEHQQGPDGGDDAAGAGEQAGLQQGTDFSMSSVGWVAAAAGSCEQMLAAQLQHQGVGGLWGFTDVRASGLSSDCVAVEGLAGPCRLRCRVWLPEPEEAWDWCSDDDE